MRIYFSMAAPVLLAPSVTTWTLFCSWRVTMSQSMAVVPAIFGIYRTHRSTLYHADVRSFEHETSKERYKYPTGSKTTN